MIVLIAEKPSFGADLARIIGAKERHDGYIDGGSLNGERAAVTWAFGHLVELDEGEEYRSRHWQAESLPVLPPAFKLRVAQKDGKPDPGKAKQLSIIEMLFANSNRIINCGDAGREGELIQKYIYEYVCERNERCRKPVFRLWVSSNTDEAIRTGLASLRPASEYEPLFLAGKARNEADWLVGLNATEALTLAIRKANPADRRVFSLGRVQTPTLALVCKRYIENKQFVSTPFWVVRIKTESKGKAFQIQSVKRFTSFEESNSVVKRCENTLVKVTEAKTEPVTLKAPLLHDLTSLQQEASRRYDYSPDETLSLLQSLYEKKLVTYPRTGSTFIPWDMMKTIPRRLAQLASSLPDGPLKQYAAGLKATPYAELNKRSVNDGKVTDHHALLLEGKGPDGLPQKEANIYMLVAERMLQAFSPNCETLVSSYRFTCGGEEFTASSTKVEKPGWKAVLGEGAKDTAEKTEENDPDKEPVQEVPPLQQGDILSVKKAETVQGKTKPKPLYTYDSLIKAMKYAGKEVEDEEVKDALKECGIGTVATRAGILAILINQRKFLKKEGKKIIPTETGLEVYNLVKDMTIADVEMTGRWEIALTAIADAKMEARSFDTNIRTYTEKITSQLSNLTIGNEIVRAAAADAIICPICHSVMRVWDDKAICSNRECGLYFNRTVFKKRLGTTTVKHLFEKGYTGLVKGFISTKTGKPFDAWLKLELSEKDGRRYANAKLQFNKK